MRFSQVYPRNNFGRPDQLTNHLFGTNSWKEVVFFQQAGRPSFARIACCWGLANAWACWLGVSPDIWDWVVFLKLVGGIPGGARCTGGLLRGWTMTTAVSMRGDSRSTWESCWKFKLGWRIGAGGSVRIGAWTEIGGAASGMSLSEAWWITIIWTQFQKGISSKDQKPN